MLRAHVNSSCGLLFNSGGLDELLHLLEERELLRGGGGGQQLVKHGLLRVVLVLL